MRHDYVDMPKPPTKVESAGWIFAWLIVGLGALFMASVYAGFALHG